jgi:flagellar basal body-associated protein FliL
MNKARGSRMVITIIILLSAVFALSIAGAASNIGLQSQATAQQQNEEIYRIQETVMSSAAPVAHTGNLPHAVVFALPIRDDGKVSTGQVTFTVSKPVEVEL